ncbi:uncharacterized protein YjbI with pentapeptide repeats [Streptomyces sp. SAI-208]|uniref:pentapeptide repeat-containing protein n=1 Tax=Streptomyces sp. SAI-208 TaxID=2940550 RepID=UPI002474E11E|nr:pentapeptide repeat-containing protein [Streptomyces sp. SAI-208]MDH6604497.1 uncharacterized protein YjbI with pentapeptide repeats [Streptomyces sp. SAI-208]
MSTAEPPSWSYCAHGAGPAADPVGCRGIYVPGRTACLAHLTGADRNAFLAGLVPGTDIDLRGTAFTEELLSSLLEALRDPATGQPRFGAAQFASAAFKGHSSFAQAVFEGDACFDEAVFKEGSFFPATAFKGHSSFARALFEGGAWFDEAVFEGNSCFDKTTFKSGAHFASARFNGIARFNSVAFEGIAWFNKAVFKADASFRSAVFDGATRFTSTFEGDAQFTSAAFKRAADLGPLVCAGRVRLAGATFGGPVTLMIAALRLECRRTRWSSMTEVRLRYATVDFAQAVFEYPLTIAAEPDPFVLSNGQMVEEQMLASAPNAGVRIASLRGVDTAHLVLADIDLSRCLFAGTVHLDQIRLEGTCTFDTVPTDTFWRRGRPARFTPRRTLAEEHHWRAKQPDAARGWNVAVLGAGRPGPAQVAPVYRALRKAFEDGKNEPGAAEFYYGEMEMRRHDRIGTSRAERGLLHAYWMLSGYGLRALRALGWLAATMLVTLVLLMGFGLPKNTPKQEATATVPPGGGKVTFEIQKGDTQNPTGNRFTGKRFEKALNVTLNSVVFRSSEQDLTAAGTYIEMTSRLMEPALLALAALAVRGRIKR